MKAENLPIKVECFRVRERGQFEAIGYVLIPLRTIPTCLYKNDEILPSPRWYKIYGVPGGVLHNKPELHLNVIIQPEQECLSASHLRGKFAEDEEDESFADPNVMQHFELKMDGENEVQQEIATPKIEEIQKAPASPEKIVEVAVEPPAQEKLIASTETHPSNNNSHAKPTDPPIVDAELYTKKLEEWKNEEKDNFMAHLKKVENIFLENMFEEWQKKKNKEENKLQTTIEECERLSKKLEDGYAQMKDVQRSEKESQSLASTQAVIQEELALERKRNAALELELREEREENKVLRNRRMKMERSNAAAELEISEQIVSTRHSTQSIRTVGSHSVSFSLFGWRSILFRSNLRLP